MNPVGFKLEMPALDKLAARLEQLATGALSAVWWDGYWHGAIVPAIVFLILIFVRGK